MKLRGSVIAVAMVVVATAACGGAETSVSESGEELTVVTVAALPNAFLAPLYVALDDGIFEEEGLDVRVVQLQSGLEGVAALASGDAQYADIGLDDLVTLSEEGSENVIMTYDLVNRVTLTLAMRNDFAEEKGVTADSPIDDKLAALEGATIGITSPGAPTDKYMRFYLERAGLDPDRDAEIVAIGEGPALLAALEEGEIDAYHLSPPTPFIAENEGFATILVNGPKGEVEELSDFSYTGFGVDRAWAEENSDAAAAFNESLSQAMEKVQSDTEGVADQILDDLGTDPADRDIVVASLEALQEAFVPDGCFTQDRVDRTLATMVNAGIIETEGDTSEGRHWTNEYNDC